MLAVLQVRIYSSPQLSFPFETTRRQSTSLAQSLPWRNCTFSSRGCSPLSLPASLPSTVLLFYFYCRFLSSASFFRFSFGCIFLRASRNFEAHRDRFADSAKDSTFEGQDERRRRRAVVFRCLSASLKRFANDGTQTRAHTGPSSVARRARFLRQLRRPARAPGASRESTGGLCSLGQ